MFTFPDPQTKDPKERKIQRVLEMIPGILTWSTIIGMPLLSFFVPAWVALFVIVFDIYWIYRTIFISSYSVIAYKKLQYGKWLDWWEKCQNTLDLESYLEDLKGRLDKIQKETRWKFVIRNRRAIKREIRHLKESIVEVGGLIKIKDKIIDWRKIVHVVMLPTAGEPADIIEPAIEAIKNSNFSNSQIIILLATEEREDKNKREEIK